MGDGTGQEKDFIWVCRPESVQKGFLETIQEPGLKRPGCLSSGVTRYKKMLCLGTSGMEARPPALTEKTQTTSLQEPSDGCGDFTGSSIILGEIVQSAMMPSSCTSEPLVPRSPRVKNKAAVCPSCTPHPFIFSSGPQTVRCVAVISWELSSLSLTTVSISPVQVTWTKPSTFRFR